MLLRFSLLLLIAFVASVHAGPGDQPPRPCNATFASMPFCDTSLSIADRVKDLISRLTLEEKAALMDNDAANISRLGLPEYQWWSEALHGVNSNCDTVSGRCPTSFPAAIGIGASFNLELVKQMGIAIGDEARALRAVSTTNFLNSIFGLDVWAPNVNIFRDPRWGRGQETPGEDPYLTGKYGATFVYYVEGAEQYPFLKLVATMKHFDAYSLESWKGMDRFHFDAIVSDQDFNQTYYPAFQTTLLEGKLHGVMCSYNSVNGVPSCAKDYLQNVLRDQWGFDGYVTSDCGAVECIYNAHNYTSDIVSAVAVALKAGTDLDCSNVYAPNIPKAVAAGLLDEATVDLSLSRLFTLQFKLGLFDPPNVYDQIPITVVDSDDHRQLAAQMARESIVLLKNDPVNGSPLLPLSKTASIALIGPNANVTETLTSNYHGQLPHIVSVLEGLTAASSGAIEYVKGANISDTDKSHIGEAVAAAQAAQVAIVVLGIDQDIESEGHDRETIDLPGVQQELLEAVLNVQPNTVLVLVNGGPVAIDWAADKVSAIVEAFYPGEEGGTAIADVLFGNYNPSGRLPVTVYPANFVNQISLESMDMREFPGKTYRFYTETPLFEFGHGLSYTSFDYVVDHNATHADAARYTEASTPLTPEQQRLVQRAAEDGLPIMIPPRQVPVYGPRDTVVYTVNVTNSGGVAGDVSVLGFISSPSSPTQDCPLKQLFGFEKVFDLAPGQAETVELSLTPAAAMCVDSQGRRFVSSGVYTVRMGSAVDYFAVETPSGEDRILL